ncbi:hypothetical protein PORY_002579 [Pneumocystis oryctolagi]|uniref:Uncharacterized protein n=1 Tax=Pneumocystis oryctolagi TaxID=42067 RepID=A0ACB7C931_9ASCO|nr:hypothetical protein PORY_002579 [Pneumocystis oryctolagi]
MEETAKGYLKEKKRDSLSELSFPPLPTIREKDKIKIGSLIKRRYSTRVGPHVTSNDHKGLDPFLTNPQCSGKSAGESQRSFFEFHLSNFSSQDFNPEEYINANFPDATEDEVSRFYVQLLQSSEIATANLQQNIFDNYSKFISISKEIFNLDTDIFTIRKHLNSLCNTIELLKDDITSPSHNLLSSEKSKWKSCKDSVADLKVIWEDQIENLFKNVEGVQKFLPTTYGRHIVYESSDWKELNCTSWKPKYKAHLFLLNDNLLVARISPKYQVSQNSQNIGKAKYIAENCFSLTEIEMIDLDSNMIASEERDMSRIIVIRREKQNFIFETDKVEEKQKLFQEFTKEYHSLTKSQRDEAEVIRKARESMYFLNAKDSSITTQRLLNSLYLNNASLTTLNLNGEIQNLQWIQDKMDELDIMIAHRLFEDAAKSIEKDIKITIESFKERSIATELIVLKLEERSLRLVDIICDELYKMSSYKDVVKKNVHYLLRLGYEDRAKNSFLTSRSNLIKRRTRQLYFKGDIVAYISDLALIHFVLIRNTAEMYISSFQKSSLISGLVTWIKIQIENFLEFFSRQISFIDYDSDIFLCSMNSIKEQCKILNELGIDMNFLLQNFEDNLKKETTNMTS